MAKQHFITGVILCALCFVSAAARAETAFRFEDHPTLDLMRIYIEKNFPLGSARDDLRAAFVKAGHATLKEHPSQPGVEKYIYDLDLCGRYRFRWNISADYDDDGKLEQAYVNGRFVFMRGTEPKPMDLYAGGQKVLTRRGFRATPLPTDPKRQISFRIYDFDKDLRTTADQMIEGYGPPRADPGAVQDEIKYAGLERWRSIFDEDETEKLVPYPLCGKVQMLNDPAIQELLMPEIRKMQGAVKDIQKSLDDIKPPAETPPATPATP